MHPLFFPFIASFLSIQVNCIPASPPTYGSPNQTIPVSNSWLGWDHIQNLFILSVPTPFPLISKLTPPQRRLLHLHRLQPQRAPTLSLKPNRQPRLPRRHHHRLLRLEQLPNHPIQRLLPQTLQPRPARRHHRRHHRPLPLRRPELPPASLGPLPPQLRQRQRRLDRSGQHVHGLVRR